jgi:hypothetical protein
VKVVPCGFAADVRLRGKSLSRPTHKHVWSKGLEDFPTRCVAPPKPLYGELVESLRVLRVLRGKKSLFISVPPGAFCAKNLRKPAICVLKTPFFHKFHQKIIHNPWPNL